ncbi:MAG: thiamine phosphate synthase [Longimicrobiales bacterium]|nr:thiamine phosphate synthase [Longimicrobiales bacterium]
MRGRAPHPGVPDEALRLIVITDARIVEARDDGLALVDVLEGALGAGARCVQLRMKGAPARELADVARALLPRVHRHGALLFVNDRADVAAAVGADGVHLGPDDVPVAAIRRAFGRSLRIGYSTDDPATARAAEADGADYIGCGAVFGTTSKELGDEAIGLDRLAAVVRAVDIPVVGIGGITPERAASVVDTGACGVAVIGAVMAAPDPAHAVHGLLAPGGSIPEERERTP